MRFIVILFTFLFSKELLSQNLRPEYEDKYLGWIKIFNPNEPEKPYTQDHRTYSAKQMAISRMIIGWIQQSYTPKGGIGQAFKLVNEKLSLYNQDKKALPQIYGGTTKTFIELKKNQQGQWIPETNTNWYMDFAVNGAIGDKSYAITTPENYFFYIPGEKGLTEEEQRVANMRGFSSQPTLKKYISWYQPKGIGTTLQYVVLLCKDNVKPYQPVTKGEYLDQLGKAIEKEAAKKIKDGNNASSVNEQLAKRKAALNRLKEKYKNRLNEPAKLKEQPDLYLENESGAEIFENRSYPSDYTVYKFDPVKLALSKSDQPQWIVISWEAEGVANGDQPGTHLHQSMLDNINYDYIYNYFFYPEKVKGIAYKPLRSPTAEQKITVTEKSNQSKKMEADASVFFFDDFSSTANGQKPTGWKSELSFDARPAIVTTVKDRNEKWLEIKGNNFVIPTVLKKPLPQNFELSFDLAVPKDIPFGTKALELFLCTQNKLDETDGFIKIRFRAGFYGRPGEITVQTKFGSAYSSYKTDYPGIGFSNDKDFNNVKVRLVKKDELLQLFFDNSKIADLPKGLPAATLFNWFQFKHLNSSSDTEKYFISSFKITKN